MTLEEKFAQLYEAWGTAIAERDNAGLLQIFDPSYIYTSSEGQRIGCDRMIEIECVLPRPEVLSPPLDVQQLTEDVVICRGIDSLRGDVPDGYVSDAHQSEIRVGTSVAFTTVWRHDGENWRVVSNDAHVIRQNGKPARAVNHNEGQDIDD